MKNSNISKKLTGVAILLSILILYPAISIPDSIENISSGLSSLGYIFLVWILTIISVASIINSKNKAKP